MTFGMLVGMPVEADIVGFVSVAEGWTKICDGWDMVVCVSVPVGVKELADWRGGAEVVRTMGREVVGASGAEEILIVGSVAFTPCVGATVVGVVEATLTGVDAGSVGVATDPDGIAEEGGRTPLATPDEDTSLAELVGVGISEASDALVSGRLVSVAVGAVPVPAPVIPDTAEERLGVSVGKAEDGRRSVIALDNTGTTGSVKDATPVPVPAPEMPELTGAAVTAAVSVGVGRIDRGSVFERTVDNPTRRPVWEADTPALGSTVETIEARGSAAGVLAGTTDGGTAPDEATTAGVGVVDAPTRGSTTDETTEANGSAAGVLAGTIDGGIAPDEATTAGVGVVDAPTRGSTTDETTEANGSAAGVLAGTIELGTPPDDATTAGVGVGVEAAAGSDDGASRDETSGTSPASAELDAGSGVEEAGITTSGADPVDATGATLDDAAGNTAATLESTPKGSEDVAAAAGSGAGVDWAGIASGLVMGADTGTADEELAKPSPATTDARGSAALDVEATTSGMVPLVTIWRLMCLGK
jgi:hypothetical protein